MFQHLGCKVSELGTNLKNDFNINIPRELFLLLVRYSRRTSSVKGPSPPDKIDLRCSQDRREIPFDRLLRQDLGSP